MEKRLIEATENHLYLIEELDKKNFEQAWSVQQIGNDFTKEFSNTFLLEVEDQIVGYMNFWIIADACELNRICVNKEFRRGGYAEYMLEQLIAHASTTEAVRILIEVSVNNIAARKLYEKLGFIEIHRREKYYHDGSDAVIMERDL